MRAPSESSPMTLSANATHAGVIYVEARGGLSRRGRAIAWILAILLIVGCTVTLAAANALPITGGRAQDSVTAAQGNSAVQRDGTGAGATTPRTTAQGDTTLSSSTIEAEWGGSAVHLDWTGTGYARIATTFVGDRLASPGDRVVRTLHVVNAGPSDGVAKVTIDLSKQIPAGAANLDLADDITLFWDVAGVTGTESFATLLANGRVAIAEVAVPQGGDVAVTVGFAMDSAVQASRALGVDSTLLSFGVGVELGGNTEPQVAPKLAMTGLTGVLVLSVIAAALLAFGLVLLLKRRRRACDDCGHVLSRDEGWIEHRSADARTHLHCESCHSSC